jgi:hypothetical protein
MRNRGVVGLTHRPVKPEIAGSSPVGSAIFAEIAQSVEQGTENSRVAGSIPALGTRWRAEVVQLVEHHLAKVGVAGSNPVFRSSIGGIAKR